MGRHRPRNLGPHQRRAGSEARRRSRRESALCRFLSEVRERGAYRDFGFSTIYDYAMQRFGFKERKTRYLLFLGRTVQELPQIREALRSKLGWCKATRIASVATTHDETTWIDSELHVHHIEFRSHGGPDEAWNCTVLCAFHHRLLHGGQIGLKG